MRGLSSCVFHGFQPVQRAYKKMTPNKQSILKHLIWIAGYDKAESSAAAKRYAAMLPEWEDLPELLTAEMRGKNENARYGLRVKNRGI
jgi:hypothetical protein